MSLSNILTRDFIFAFFALFAYSAGYFVLIPTLPIFLSQLKAGESEIGILIGIFSVSSLIFRPFVGKALLRIPERTFMLAGGLLAVLSSVALFVARPFWPFFWVRVFQGISLALVFTSSTALIANISQERYRGRSLGYFLLSNNVAFALAPPFGMFLINRFGFTSLFLFCATVSLASLLLSAPLRRRDNILSNDPRIDLKIDSPPGPSTGGGGLFSRQALPSSIMAVFTHMIWGSITAFFPLYALEQGVTNSGFFFTIFAITLILCRTLGGKWLDRYSREEILFPCFINYITAVLLLAFSKTIPMFALIAVIWGAGTAFAYPTLVALTLDLCGPNRGPAMGTFTAFTDLGVGLGAVIMGMVLSVTNYRTMFLCLTLIGLINFLYFNSFVRKRAVSRE
jgi:predicted MFS family arabinose efflux permease